jgi:hypothetical protein
MNYAEAELENALIVHDDPHRTGGVPHFHIEAGPRRSAHIFYGPLPAGDFFAAA